LASRIDYAETARRQLEKLDKPVARRILNLFDNRVAKLDDPRTLGKPLSGPLGTLWRFRIGDFRAICEIKYPNDEGPVSTILILRIGHRREIYR
jgi:mRNA interferase RelE/StbE